MTTRKGQTRALIYSHDSFGLGHLRRCRAIAHALVERNRDMSVVILSGSPIIGNFDFRQRVDVVRVPGGKAERRHDMNHFDSFKFSEFNRALNPFSRQLNSNGRHYLRVYFLEFLDALYDLAAVGYFH